MIIAGPLCTATDAAYRWKRLERHWYHPNFDGSLFFVPLWMLGIPWLALGVAYTIQGRDQGRGAADPARRGSFWYHQASSRRAGPLSLLVKRLLRCPLPRRLAVPSACGNSLLESLVPRSFARPSPRLSELGRGGGPPRRSNAASASSLGLPGPPGRPRSSCSSPGPSIDECGGSGRFGCCPRLPSRCSCSPSGSRFGTPALPSRRPNGPSTSSSGSPGSSCR